jgi:hypothetical protein
MLNDFVKTPIPVTEALLKYETFVGSILEPCCGDGAIANVLKQQYIVDCSDKIDWVETKLGWLFAWYIWDKEYSGDVIVKRIDYKQSQNKLF